MNYTARLESMLARARSGSPHMLDLDIMALDYALRSMRLPDAGVGDDRCGDWNCSYTGRRYWSLDPRPEDIDFQDVAHALANICRFNGHCREFYSVAQHSVYVSHIVPPEHALAGLMHDGPEAYVGDVTRPLKRSDAMRPFVEAEARWDAAFAARLGLPELVPAAVKVADNRMLATEAWDIMPQHTVKDWFLPHPPLAADERVAVFGHPGFVCWSPQYAERRFLERLAALLPGDNITLQPAYDHAG